MRIRIGVIPAAGRGKRLSELPLLRILPKSMLPIIDKPILEYVLENLKKLGTEVVYIIVGYKKDAIKEYFKNVYLDLEINYIEQKELKGIAHAISLTEKYISEPFAVILGDDFTIARTLQNFIKTFQKRNAWVVEGVVKEPNIEVLKRTCSVIIEKGTQRIIDIVEKPKKPISNLRGIGIYIFDPIIFDFIKQTPISPKSNEIEITDTIRLVAQAGRAYCAWLKGINININTYSDLLHAIMVELRRRQKFKGWCK